MSNTALEIEVSANLARFKSAMDEMAVKSYRASNKVQKNLRNIRKVGREMVSGLSLPAGGLFAGIIAGSVSAGKEFQRLNRLLSKSDMQFVRSEADRLGLSLSSSADGFAKITAAAKGTRLEGQGARDIFTAVATASTAMGLSADESNGALKAIEQMMSKGKVSAEELRGQLGERLPGAFRIASQAMGVSQSELNKLLEQGKLMSDDFLPKFAKRLEEEWKGKAVEASKSFQAEQSRLATSFLELRAAISDSGILKFVAEFIAKLKSVIEWLSKVNPSILKWGVLITGVVAALGPLILLIGQAGLAVSALTGLWGLMAAGAAKVTSGLLTVTNAVGLTKVSIGALSKTVGLFAAAFAGWQIGTWAREKFLAVRLAGIYLVQSLGVVWENMKFAAKAATAYVGSIFNVMFETVRKVTAKLAEKIASSLKKIPLDKTKEWGNSLDEVAGNLEKASGKTQSYKEQLKQLRAEKDKNVAKIKQLTGDMADYEIEAEAVSKRVKKVTDVSKGFEVATKSANEAVEETVITLPKADKKYLKLGKAINDVKNKIFKLTSVYGEYDSAGDQVNHMLLENIKKKKQLAGVTAQLDKHLAKGNISLKEYKEMLGQVGGETTKTVITMQDVWDRFADSAQDSLKPFFRSALDGWDGMKKGFKSLGDSLKSTAKDIVADLISTFASNKLKSIFQNLFKPGDAKSGIGGVFKSLFGGKGVSSNANSPTSILSSIFGGKSGIGSIVDKVKGLFSSGGGLFNIFGQGGSLASLGSTIASLAPPIAVIATLLKLGKTKLGKAFGLVFDVFKGGRSPQQLGEDQLAAVDAATKAGRNKQVQLGSTAGVSTSFLGGFDENSTFFGADLKKDELQKVGDVLKSRYGFDQALALKDGVIRLEDFSRKFSENNEAIVAEVKASIAQVKLGFTDMERGAIQSFSKLFEGGRDSLIKLDQYFDESAGSGKTAAERLRLAYTQAFGATDIEARKWINSLGISADRLGQIFDSTSNDILTTLVGDFDKISSTATSTFDGVSGAIKGSLSGILGKIDYGRMPKFNIPINAVRSARVAPPKLNVGTPYVKSDGLAYLHRGEAVLTAEQNRNRSGGDVRELSAKLDAVIVAINKGTEQSQVNTQAVTNEVAKSGDKGIGLTRKAG